MKDILQDKQFLIALEEWNNNHELAAQIEDVIAGLTEEKRNYSRVINCLVTSFQEAVEARTRAFEELKKFCVIECHEDALYYACKAREQSYI